MTNAIQTLDPPEALRPWVTSFVLRDEPGRGQVVRVLPESRPSIQIVLGDPYWVRASADGTPWIQVPRAGLWCPRYGWGYGWPQGHIRIFGLGLTPAGLRALTGLAAPEMNGWTLHLADYSPKLSAALEALPACELPVLTAASIPVLVDTFKDHDPWDPIGPAALECLAAESSGAVAEAARLCGLSERHFYRVFVNLYGVTPKTYQRYRRIDRMIRSLHQNPWETDPLKDLASGFSDQSHMIREFQALTGLTPDAYARAVKRVGGPVLRSVPEEGVAPPPFDSLPRN